MGNGHVTHDWIYYPLDITHAIRLFHKNDYYVISGSLALCDE